MTTLLEIVIALYALSLLVLAVSGGVDLGFLSINQAEKPILVLLVLVPVRLALGRPWWMAERLHLPLNLARARLAAVAARVPPAIADVAFALIVTRLATWSVAFLANLLFTPYRTRPFSMPFERGRLAEVFAEFDSGWYFDIAHRGYYFSDTGQSSIAFFPLYPMLMRALAWPFGGSERAIWLAGIVVSCAAFTVAMVALHRFTERVTGSPDVARRTVLYLAIFPFSFFFTRVYAEAVFLLTTVLAISRAYDGRWWQAGVWGGLAAIARPNGVLIAVPLALLALQGRPAAAALARRGAALLLVPAALGGYSLYVYSLSGDPFAWLSAQTHWGYSLGHPPWQQLLRMLGRLARYGFYDYFFVSPMAAFRLFHGVTALLFIAVTPFVFKQFGPALGAYVLASLLVPLSGNALEGVGRYAAVLFPAFIVVGRITSQRLHETMLVVACVFLTFFVSLFGTGRPIY